MSLSVIPLVIMGQITGASVTEDASLYQVTFKDINGDPLYGVTAVWTDEQAEIEALAAQKPYGVWINPIDGTFTVKFAGYTYVGSADLTDPDVLAGITPIEFTSAEVSDRLLPEVDSEDAGKTVVVNEDGEWELGEAGSATIIIPVNKLNTTGARILSAIEALTNNNNYSSHSPLVTINDVEAKAQIDLLNENSFESSLLKDDRATQSVYFLPDTYQINTDSGTKQFVYKAVVNLFEQGLGTSEPLKIIYVTIFKSNNGSSYSYTAAVKGVSYDLSNSHDAFTTPSAVYAQLVTKMNALLTAATTNLYAHDIVLVGSEADNAAFANDIKQVAYMVSSGKTVVTTFGEMYGKPIHANYTESENAHLYEFGVETFITQFNYYYRLSLWYHSSSDDGIYIDMFAELMGIPSGD